MQIDPCIRKYLNCLLVSLAFGLLSHQLIFKAFAPFSPLGLTLELSAPVDLLQVYYKDDLNQEYDPANVITTAITNDGKPQTFRFILPPVGLKYIRIDPATKPANLKVLRICLNTIAIPTNERCWNPAQIERDFISRQHITSFKLDGDSILLTNIGSDPYFETRPELEIFLYSFAKKSSAINWSIVLTLFVIAFAISLRVGTCSPVFNISNYTFSRPILSSFCLLVFGVIFLYLTAAIQKKTPPFQGPDEVDHLAKLVAYELEKPCGVISKEILAEWDNVSYLPHHPELKWKKAEKLNSETLSTDSSAFVERENGQCRFHSMAVALPQLINHLRGIKYGSLGVVGYLEQTRRSLSISALLSLILPLLLVLFGRELWQKREEHQPQYLRLASLLCFFYIVFLPQTLWIGSVLGQDYLLISAGITLAVSAGLRINWLSDLLIFTSLYIASGKSVYLPPSIFLAGIHYLLLFKPRFLREQSLKGALVLGSSSIVGVIASISSVRYLARHFCKSFYCFGIDELGFVGSWRSFGGEIGRMLSEFHVLLLPNLFHQQSAFGNFGWHDTPMPGYASQLYITPIMWLFCVSVIASSYYLARVVFGYENFNREYTIRLIQIGVSLFLYWVISFLCIYLIFSVMRHWCGGDSLFGCAYQKRYELPLYPFIILIIYLMGFEWCRKSGKQQNSINVLFVILLIGQLFVAYFSTTSLLEVLQRRYVIEQSESIAIDSEEHNWAILTQMVNKRG